jgi:hypothetical protein
METAIEPQGVPLVEVTYEFARRAIAAGVPVDEVVKNLLAVAVDLTTKAIGPVATARYMADIAIAVDEADTLQ